MVCVRPGAQSESAETCRNRLSGPGSPWHPVKNVQRIQTAPRTSNLAKLFPRPSAARLSTHARPAPAKSNTAMWVSVRERERPILAYPQPVVWEPQAGEVRPRVRPAGRGNRTWFGWSLNSPRPTEKKMASEVGWTVFTQDFVGFGMEK